MTADDRSALEELRRLSTSTEPRVVLHYLYFPRQKAAAAAAVELRGRGFDVEERRGADGVNFLALARHKIVLTEEAIAQVRDVMEALTRRCGGEYDGWEAQVT